MYMHVPLTIVTPSAVPSSGLTKQRPLLYSIDSRAIEERAMVAPKNRVPLLPIHLTNPSVPRCLAQS